MTKSQTNRSRVIFILNEKNTRSFEMRHQLELTEIRSLKRNRNFKVSNSILSLYHLVRMAC